MRDANINIIFVFKCLLGRLTGGVASLASFSCSKKRENVHHSTASRSYWSEMDRKWRMRFADFQLLCGFPVYQKIFN